jgi:CRISPR-associated protein Cas1
MRTVYVTEDGATLRREGRALHVWTGQKKGTRVPTDELEQLVLVGNIIVTPAALDLLVDKGVDTVFLSHHGRFRGRLTGALSTNVTLRLAQYKLMTTPAEALTLAKTIVAGKTANQRELVLRQGRKLTGGITPDLAKCERSMRATEARLGLALTMDQVRGCEGAASAAYFKVLGQFIRAPGFTFDGRNRRPPMDPVNALLSLGYTLLTNAVAAAVEVVGMDPFVGSLHEVSAGRPSLVCDLVEEYRAPVVDRLVLAAVNQGALRPEDFEGTGADEPVVVKREAVRWFVTLFERRMGKQVIYPPLGKKLSWRQIIEAQTRRMARHVLGREPFACVLAR